jgi:hypothetical protein
MNPARDAALDGRCTGPAPVLGPARRKVPLPDERACRPVSLRARACPPRHQPHLRRSVPDGAFVARSALLAHRLDGQFDVGVAAVVVDEAVRQYEKHLAQPS